MGTARPRWPYRSRGVVSLLAILVLPVLTPHPRATHACTRGIKLPISNRHGKREQCGFTLIEILVVVVIIGVLAAIVIPAFSDSSSDAQLTVCLENLRLIQQALSVYRMKVGTYPSSANDLVVEGYLSTLPACPLGGSYNWDLKDDRYHIRCSAQHTPSSDHACIHEDQPPTAK